MIMQRMNFALLAGAILAVTGSAHAGNHGAPATDCCTPTVSCAPACPTTQKVLVTEWVPEQYKCTKTVYKTECKQETYTAYKTECVPETRTRTVTCYHKVCETVMETRQTCVKVPYVEEKTIMKTCTVCKPVTCMVRKCEDHGHYECQEVPCGPSILDRLKKFGHKSDCCDPCAPVCCEPVKTKTVKVWVPCKVWVECPVTKMVRTTECHPEVVKVTCCKTEIRCEQVPCTRVKCVPECKTETYTVNVQKCIPYQATRTVSVCVPCQEEVTMTRLVCRKVEKEVPVCATECCKPSFLSCSRLFGLLSH